MFTGIIQAVGEVAAMVPSGGDLRLRVHTGKLPLADVNLGDSIATNGCCLTVVELPGDGFWAGDRERTGARGPHQRDRYFRSFTGSGGHTDS